MVGSSIADIYNPRRHIYLGASCLGKYAAEVVYRAYGPTYCIIYTIYGIRIKKVNVLRA